MEYTFKNSLSEKATTILLRQTHLVVQSPDKEESIPYSEIRSVKLSRSGRDMFSIRLVSKNNSSISISNKYCLPTGEVEDRSRQYVGFVRVLHYHLKDKSAPVYTSGKSFRKVIMWTVLAAFCAFLISFVSEFFEMSLMNPFVQSMILTAVIAAAVIGYNKGEFPKEYSPEEIPLQFLP